MMRQLISLAAFAFCLALPAQQKIKTGPEIGSAAPAIEAVDQNGAPQNLKSISGPKGAILVFFRSADW
jgi:hypothetical protein